MAPVILSKMQILGTFLPSVRVVIYEMSVLEMMPMLFLSSFPPLSQHSPNSTRTSLWASFNVKCWAHRELIGNISQVWKSLQDFGLSPLSGQKYCPVQKIKIFLRRLENKSRNGLQCRGSDLYLLPACTGPCTPVGRQKKPTTAKRDFKIKYEGRCENRP